MTTTDPKVWARIQRYEGSDPPHYHEPIVQVARDADYYQRIADARRRRKDQRRPQTVLEWVGLAVLAFSTLVVAAAVVALLNP